MSDHSSFVTLASRLLQKNGRSSTLTIRTTTPGANPWDIAVTTDIPLTVIMMFVPTTVKDDKGTIIPGNFQRCYFASADAEAAYADWVLTNAPSLDDSLPILTTKDVITDGDREYRIVRLGQLKPGDQSILYDLLVAG
jgi:hypothetical protein